MKTYTQTQTFKLFTFNELSIDAQETAEQNYLNDFITQEFKADVFEEWAKDHIEGEFKETVDVWEFYYSLSYCQGDGVCFEGAVDALEFLKEFKDYLKLEENDYLTLLNYLEENGGTHYIKHSGGHYYHSYSVYHDLETPYLSWDYEGEENEHLKALLRDLEDSIKYYFEDVCAGLEHEGYEWFYNLDESDYEILEEYYYTEDGEEFGRIEDIDGEAE